MVHVIFDGAAVTLENVNQSGSGFSYFEGSPPYQRGYGYYAVSRQKGDGLGSIFKSLWRFLKPVAARLGPVASSAAKALGEEGLAAGARILGDLSQGGDLKETAIKQGREGVRNLLDQASQILQRSSGRKRKRRSIKSFKKPGIVFKPADDVVVGSSIPKKAIIKKSRFDSLGHF